MRKWIKFFFGSFFSNKLSKQSTKRGYTNVFLSLILALIYTCIGVVWADTLPFGTHYNNATEFKSMVRDAFVYPQGVYGIDVEIKDGKLKASKTDNFESSLIVDTFNNQQDAKDYVKKGYQLVVDTRPADALCKVQPYCVSTDEQKTVITYEEYLSLNDVARRNFEFKLKYTNEQLILDHTMIEGYKTFLNQSGQEIKTSLNELLDNFNQGKITKEDCDRGIYQLYFKEYYPEITNYESNSDVPLLRNYYFHELIGQGKNRFLMVFDDCMVGSFATDGGLEVFFYGFYNGLPDGKLIEGYFDTAVSINAVDNFVKKSFKASGELSSYIYIMNTLRLIPIIALMVIVVTMLAHSIMSLKGVDTCKTFGASLKVVGSYLWFAGIITAILTIIFAFMVKRELITMVFIVAFFVTLLVRTVFFVIGEIKNHKTMLERLLQEEEDKEDIQTDNQNA